VEEKIVGYDPMTGEPIKESAVVEDPKTVEPEVVEEKIVGYDPMTGEPIKESAPVEEKVVSFDPMTGKPVTENSAPGNTTAPKFDVAGLLKNKVLIAVAAVVVVVLVAIFSGVFVSSHTKVLLAVANTFSDESKLSKACQGLGLLTTDSYTVSAKADVEGQLIEGSFAAKKNEMQLTGKVDIKNYPEVEATIGLDSKQVRAKADIFEDQLFVYDFTKENDGYLMEEFNDEQVEMINNILKNVTSESQRNDIVKKVANAVVAEYEEWEIKKADKKKFEVDGKDRNCAGYTLTLTEECLEDLVDAVFEALEEDIDEEILDALYDECDNMFKGMEDVETSIYIYKDMLAAIVFDIDGNELEVLFLGGDFRTQNILVEANGNTGLELEGKTEGSVESYELEVSGESVFALEYDAKSGDLEIELTRYGTTLEVEANLKGSANEFAFLMDMDALGVDGEVEVYIEKGAKMQELSGEEFNIGTADKSDWEDLAEELYDALY